jgi:hypothetical protein
MQVPPTIAPGQQHMLALRRANEVRLARAELKRRVAEGELTVSEVVLDVPPEADGMAVMDLLMSQHRWGRTRCRKFLMAVAISENKTLGRLTARQRGELASMLHAAEGQRTSRPRAVPALV